MGAIPPCRHPSYLFGLNRPHTGSEWAILKAPVARWLARSRSGSVLGAPNGASRGSVSVSWQVSDGLGQGEPARFCTNAHGQACVRRCVRAQVRACVRTRAWAWAQACVSVRVCVCFCFVFHGFKCVGRTRKQSNKLSRTHNEPDNNQTIPHGITTTANNETIPHGQRE